MANGVATVKGDAAGTTGGMSAKFARQKYGRWETRMKTNARDPQYHPVLILWPTKPSATCDEIDYAEGSGKTSKIKFFLHYECSGSSFQTQVELAVDTTQWHNYAVEWTPAGITGYVDGVKTSPTRTRRTSPPVPCSRRCSWTGSPTALPLPPRRCRSIGSASTSKPAQNVNRMPAPVRGAGILLLSGH